MQKRLYRSRSDRMIWGVCGGIAEYFEIDPTIVRLIAVLLVFAGGIGILAYIILAIVMPLEGTAVSEPREVVKENVAEMKQTATQLGAEIRTAFTRQEQAGEPQETSKTRQRTGYSIAIILIILGVLFLLDNLNIFSWFHWGTLWPLLLIAIGLVIIFGGRRR
ncbi:MAG: PspC domain-containing protein [Chloroflexi bacterium]|nr:PspC domain-containing protein [Chloroflexota bacterium]